MYCLAYGNGRIPVSGEKMYIGSGIVFESLVFLRGEKHGKILMATIKRNLVEDFVLAEIALVRHIVEDHKHGSDIILFSTRISRDELLFLFIHTVNLVDRMVWINVCDRNMFGKFFDYILGGRLYESRMKPTCIVIENIFNQDCLAAT
jgi:hypothetical protein